MALERKVVIDQIEINRNGYTGVRMAILILEDGKEIDCKWHRTAVDPSALAEEQMAVVNAHLQEMGLPPVSDEDIAKLALHDDLTSPAKEEARLARAVPSAVKKG